ncbi:hypothetical protein SAMN05216203_2419 [Marinobacter daqiaonensis]|uniref:histidine kinase n=1 Tax=Marinobacter daqiaonensis TaxID=650891 RepID=A0A1I6IKQ9_9GAMM|nr:PAS domain S-box protein [Marinobacter daqiaonensis]SFR67229.1 hypothetical protein SAMN05216203_2419 [Marinobacter daqiaonensis]
MTESRNHQLTLLCLALAAGMILVALGLVLSAGYLWALAEASEQEDSPAGGVIALTGGLLLLLATLAKSRPTRTPSAHVSCMRDAPLRTVLGVGVAGAVLTVFIWELLRISHGHGDLLFLAEPMGISSHTHHLSETLVLAGGLAVTTLMMITRLFGVLGDERNRRLARLLQREQELRETNERIISFSSDLLCTIDQEGRFRFVSPACEPILGYRPEEMIGHRALEFMVEEDRKPSVQAAQGVRQDTGPGTPQFRNRYYHKDGHVVTLNWKARLSSQDDTLFCVGRDITPELKAEELAHQREAFFSLTPEIFCIVSARNRFVEVNKTFLKTLGYTRAEVVEIPYLNLIEPSWHDTVMDAIERLADGETIYDLEIQLFHRDGSLRWLRVNASMSRDRLIYCSARDITAELQVQKELRANEQLLRMAEQIGRLGGWMVDVTSGRSVWSDAVCDIHEMAPDQVPDMNEALQFYTPEYRPVVRQAVRQAIVLGLPFDLEARITTATGRLRWVRLIGRAVRDERGEVISLQGAFQDISAGKEASEQIRRLAERQSRIFESITDAFFTLDREWRFTFMNRKCEELLQQSRGEVIGESLWEVFPEAIGTEFESQYRQAMNTGETASFEAYFAPLDLWSEANAYPSEDGLAVYFRSINERVEAERELKATLAELERSNSELQDFAFVASHDLQEPLRKIQAFSDRLTRNPDHFDEREQDYLRRMRSAAERMQGLIMDLLSYSRINTRAQPFVRCDLTDILEGVQQDLESAITASRAVVEARPLPEIAGDPSQLRQVMQNLLSNAIKFSRPDVRPRIVIYPEDVSVRGWTLVIQDNGIGFEPKYADRMFQPFQRLHNKHEYAGTGIGLAIVRKIIDRHDAVIVADSRPGEGATFRIHFRHPDSLDQTPGVSH